MLINKHPARFVLSAACVLLMLVLNALPVNAGNATAMAAETDATYVDATGGELQYGLNARRIVSLAPNVTEMLFFLGLGERAVGRSAFCDYPPAAAELPSIGGFVDTSLESIVVLNPDLVIAYQGNSRELVDQLRRLDIPVLAFTEATTLPEIGQQMQVIHSIAAPPAQSTPPALKQWSARLEQLTAATRVLSSAPSMFFGYPGEISYSAGAHSFVGDLMQRAGARNVITKGAERWPAVSAEFIVNTAPQWLLTATDCSGQQTLADRARELKAELAADSIWAALPAVRDGHVLVLEASVLLRPGPRILDALETVISAVHPGVLQRAREQR